MKKSKDCLKCGIRILPSRWKIKYCEKCHPGIIKEHNEVMKNITNKMFNKK